MCEDHFPLVCVPRAWQWGRVRPATCRRISRVRRFSTCPSGWQAAEGGDGWWCVAKRNGIPPSQSIRRGGAARCVAAIPPGAATAASGGHRHGHHGGGGMPVCPGHHDSVPYAVMGQTWTIHVEVSRVLHRWTWSTLLGFTEAWFQVNMHEQMTNWMWFWLRSTVYIIKNYVQLERSPLARLILAIATVHW